MGSNALRKFFLLTRSFFKANVAAAFPQFLLCPRSLHCSFWPRCLHRLSLYITVNRSLSPSICSRCTDSPLAISHHKHMALHLPTGPVLISPLLALNNMVLLHLPVLLHMLNKVIPRNNQIMAHTMPTKPRPINPTTISLLLAPRPRPTNLLRRCRKINLIKALLSQIMDNLNIHPLNNTLLRLPHPPTPRALLPQLTNIPLVLRPLAILRLLTLATKRLLLCLLISLISLTTPWHNLDLLRKFPRKSTPPNSTLLLRKRSSPQLLLSKWLLLLNKS